MPIYIDSEKEYKSFIRDIENKDILCVHLTSKSTLNVIYVLNMDTFNDYVLLYNHYESMYICDFEYLDKANNILLYQKSKFIYDIECVDLNDYLFYYNHNTYNIDIDEISEIELYETINYKYISSSKLIIIFNQIKHYFYKRYKKNTIKKALISYSNYINNFIKYSYNNGIYYNEKILNHNYKFYTKTNRPTNSVNKINLIGLNKDGKQRKLVSSRYDKDGILVEFDYSAYHLQIISKLIQYEFKENVNIHRHIGKIYYGVDSLSESQYEKIKQINFKLMYGNIPQELLKIEFFNKVQILIDNIWNFYEKKGFIYTKYFNRKIIVDDPNKGKVFNYYLQSYEIEQNLFTLNKIIKLLKSYKSILSLYVHDSFLFDYHVDDGNELINNLKKIISIDGKYNYTIKIGKTYKELKTI